MNIATTIQPTEKLGPDLLTETIVSKLGNPETSSDFDFHGAVNHVLKYVGLSTADSGGNLAFYGRDPIIPSPIGLGLWPRLALPPRQPPSRRCGDPRRAKDRTLRWMSAKLSGGSPASSI